MEFFIFTGRNEVVAKVMFLLVSVILLTWGCLPQCMLGYHPPGADTPQEQTPPGQDTHPRSRYPPPPDQTPSRADSPPGSRLRHMVNERPVRILLECILVTARKRSLGQGNNFTGMCHSSVHRKGWGGWLPSMHHRSHDWGV